MRHREKEGGRSLSLIHLSPLTLFCTSNHSILAEVELYPSLFKSFCALLSFHLTMDPFFLLWLHLEVTFIPVERWTSGLRCRLTLTSIFLPGSAMHCLAWGWIFELNRDWFTRIQICLWSRGQCRRKFFSFFLPAYYQDNRMEKDDRKWECIFSRPRAHLLCFLHYHCSGPTWRIPFKR